LVGGLTEKRDKNKEGTNNLPVLSSSSFMLSPIIFFQIHRFIYRRTLIDSINLENEYSDKNKTFVMDCSIEPLLIQNFIFKIEQKKIDATSDSGTSRRSPK
jgi:hypothetical protein